MATEGTGEGEKKDDAAAGAAITRKKSGGFFSQISKGIFKVRLWDDIGKRLEKISKEEAMVQARMKKRARSWSQKFGRFIPFVVLSEMIAVVYAVMMKESLDTDTDWKMRALRILPALMVPVISLGSYSAYQRFDNMRSRKDERTLKRLQAEKKELLDELKEKNNYYTTQEIIQKYDTDPAAKAAAAAVLASKLGADSGLKVYTGDDSLLNASVGKSNDAELVQSSGLRKRKESQATSISEGGRKMHHSSDGGTLCEGNEDPWIVSKHEQVVVEHYDPNGVPAQDGGWVVGLISSIARFLVAEDPAQAVALICGNCHIHNGLVPKEDFLHTQYYCPHCHALNQPKKLEDSFAGSVSPHLGVGSEGDASGSPKEAPSMSSNSAEAESEIVEAEELQAETDESVAH